MNNIKIEKTNKIIYKIGRGVIVSLLITLLGIFVFAALLTYTNISENIIPVVIIIMTCISIFIGSITSMRKELNNGMLKGSVVGATYVILLYLISSILNTGFYVNMYTVMMMILGIIFGIIGGIIGVNL